MKPRKLSRVNKVELALGVIMPAVIFAPFMMFGLISFMLTSLFRADTIQDISKEFMLIFTVMILVGLFALFFLCLVILVGPDQIKEKFWLRLISLVSIVCGIVLSAWVIKTQLPGLNWSLGDPKNYSALGYQLPGLIVLLGSMIVGLRYIPPLISSK